MRHPVFIYLVLMLFTSLFRLQLVSDILLRQTVVGYRPNRSQIFEYKPNRFLVSLFLSAPSQKKRLHSAAVDAFSFFLLSLFSVFCSFVHHFFCEGALKHMNTNKRV